MDSNFKYDVIEKLLELLGLMYFLMGFMTSFVWACKQLDLISDRKQILIFWEPVAGVMSVLNIANVIVIIFFFCKVKKYPKVQSVVETNVLFYWLATPLFIATVVYMVMGIVKDVYIYEANGLFSLLLSLGEVALFCTSMMLIVNVTGKTRNPTNRTGQYLKKFVTFITAVGLLNYFLFHLTSLQIRSFTQAASNESTYEGFYNPLLNRNETRFDFTVIKIYMQPLVILYCFIGFVYLVIAWNSCAINNYEIELSERLNVSPSIEKTENDSSNFTLHYSFRIPPLPLLLGILFATVTLLVISIVYALLQTDKLSYLGQWIFTIFPIPVYFISIFLMIIQLNEIKRWPKLRENENIIDKILVWIGASGQLIVSLGQIKYYCFYNIEPSFSWITRLEFIILIIQTILQSITLCLALDRKWLSPLLKTWQARICPPVGLLSINLAFLIFSIYVVRIDETNINNKIQNKSPLFAKLFGVGFVSFGETLAILQRMHSALIFARLMLSSNQ